MSKAEKIAKGLSPMMRKAMLHRNAGGSSYGWTNLSTCEALNKRSLVGRICGPGGFWSPQTAISWPLTPPSASPSAPSSHPVNRRRTMGKVENPPAFPNDDTHPLYSGMTLRDYFAGQALAGISRAVAGGEIDPSWAAAHCYTLADALLAARKGGE